MREPGKEHSGQKNSTCKGSEVCPCGSCTLDRAKRKGKERGRAHIMRDFTERSGFHLKIGCTIKDSKLESARPDLILRDHSGSDGE